MDYYQKYLKYKNKYLNLKKTLSGGFFEVTTESKILNNQHPVSIKETFIGRLFGRNQTTKTKTNNANEVNQNDMVVANVIPADGVTANVVPGDATNANNVIADAPTGDAPTGDAPTTDNAIADAPTGDAPTGDAPTGDAPTGDAPTADYAKQQSNNMVGGKNITEIELGSTLLLGLLSETE